jgi:hypothetical protein
LATRLGVNAIATRASKDLNPHQILIGTYHKSLTVFMGRMFRAFGAATGKSFSRGRSSEVDYAADIIQDYYCAFDWNYVRAEHIGLRVIRDPRDLVVSAASYHCVADEAWLLKPREDFNGLSYQEYIKSLPNEEERLIFEIDRSASYNIRRMLDWQPQKNITEHKFEELVSVHGADLFATTVDSWPLASRQRRLLKDLFIYFSIQGPGSKRLRHINDPSDAKWRKHFTPRVHEHFNRRFPGAVAQLGYS